MATADQETQITFFANPFLRCDTCNRRAVGIVGPMNQVVNLLSGLITISMPTQARNWPCYDIATRTSVCDGWTSTSGCPHTTEERAQHSNVLGYEGMRR
jgi:hypothetical protein